MPFIGARTPTVVTTSRELQTEPVREHNMTGEGGAQGRKGREHKAHAAQCLHHHLTPPANPASNTSARPRPPPPPTPLSPQETPHL
jgi:hypothetical protein